MKLKESGAPELESITHKSPCEWERWHKWKRAGDGGAAFTCPMANVREWESGGEISQRKSIVSKYAPTSVTNCSLRSSSDGNPTSGGSVWKTDRRGERHIAKNKTEVTPTFKGVCSSQLIFDLE